LSLLMPAESKKFQSMQRADLHCHSNISDGVLEPADLARRASANGVELWALTDHDEVAGVAVARQVAQSLNLPFLAGVEISVTWAGRTLHVVGLGIDDAHPALLGGLAAIRQQRIDRAKGMGQRFNDLGYPGTYEGALRVAGNPGLISRTHFARHLVQTGQFSHMQAVFDQYLKDDGAAFVPTVWPTLEQALGWIHAASGVAVIAHPGRYRYTELQFDGLFTAFKDLGGEAIEVNTGSHNPWQFQTYADVAKHYGFLASTGSDFHGPKESRCDLGEVPFLHQDLTPVWHAPAIEARLV
jgi:3',5'-nucleoside bisphosphate phosphatase